jgi:uncharacterized protein (TIGR02246 family)
MEKAVQRLRAAVLAAVIGLAVLGDLAAVAAEPLGKPMDENEVRQVITEMTEGFNRHDGRAASSMYLPNATFVTVRGEMMEGQSAIEKGLTSIFQTRARNATLRTLDVTIQFLRPDIALAHVLNELSGLLAPDGQPLPSHQELSLRVFTKEDGRWQLATFQNTMIRPFVATPR